ncbi:unnamed protein product [Calypogeia fissa]
MGGAPVQGGGRRRPGRDTIEREQNWNRAPSASEGTWHVGEPVHPGKDWGSSRAGSQGPTRIIDTPGESKRATFGAEMPRKH